MADIQGEIKRGFLRSLWRNARNGTPSLKLLQALDAFQSAKFSDIKAGRRVAASASNGHSVNFQLPSQSSQFTEEQIFSLAEEFQAVYADAQITLSANGTTVNDENIFNCMMADVRLQSITRMQDDFTIARWQARSV